MAPTLAAGRPRGIPMRQRGYASASAAATRRIVMDRVQDEASAEVAAGADAGLTAGYDPRILRRDVRRQRRARPHCAASTRAGAMGTVDSSRSAGVCADLAFINQGITFTVYADRRGTEKIFPFDLVPRIVAARRVGPASSAGWSQRDPRPEPVPRTTSTTTSGSSRTGSSRAELVLIGAGISAARWSAFDVAAATSTSTSAAPTWSATATASSCVLEDNVPHARAACQLRAGEPRGDEAGLPAALPAATASGRSRTIRATCCADAPLRRAAAGRATRRASSC